MKYARRNRSTNFTAQLSTVLESLVFSVIPEDACTSPAQLREDVSVACVKNDEPVPSDATLNRVVQTLMERGFIA